MKKKHAEIIQVAKFVCDSLQAEFTRLRDHGISRMAVRSSAIKDLQKQRLSAERLAERTTSFKACIRWLKTGSSYVECAKQVRGSLLGKLYLKTAIVDECVKRLEEVTLEFEKLKSFRPVVYKRQSLHGALLQVYNTPEVVVDETRRPTVNVLVPAFDFASMSAGFFGVFQVALFIKSCGLHVRLVMYDRFNFDEAYIRKNLKNYPGMENLLDELEVAYIGDRVAPLRISPKDSCVATVWYSAYLARKIMETRGGGKFLYLIQDYESVFSAANSQFALADATYGFDCAMLFSSKALQDFFLTYRIGLFMERTTEYIYFNNACSSVLPPEETFVGRRGPNVRRRLAFYCRPPVPRNMFELGALALCEAYAQGVFEEGAWEFIGIGLGEAVIELAPGVMLNQMERMNLTEYCEVISTFDVGFCLMASSHPSLLPFDLSGSGAVVVTNSFGVKNQAYFDTLTKGVIVSKPDLPALVDGLRKAVAQSSDLTTRYANAKAMTFPRSWDETFGQEHREWIRQVFATTMSSS